MSSRRSGFRLRRFPPVQLFLYLVMRTVFMVVGMFRWSLAPVVGRRLGLLLRFLDRRHTGVAARNLERTRGVCAPDAIPAFVDRLYAHIGLSFVEMLMLPGLIERGCIEDFTRFRRFDVAERVLRAGRGLIVVIGHLGNWEVMGLAICKAGYPLNSLARPIENPWIDAWLNRFRTRTGQRIIPKRHALGEMIRVLHRNEILIVQVDQNAKSAGVLTDFFGRPCSTHRSPAILSLKYGTPIIVANIYRENGLHHCDLGDPIDPARHRDHADPVKSMTQAYTAEFEQAVRAHPDQWFWVHERWKHGEKSSQAGASPVPAGAGPS
ncbi:MAG TPA: lysophospholipid acyltransferase family protein [Planctomycetota bacterium]|nr:lysophospholipid acyltransferase family protein [Planctomycetota bacterium]